MTQLVSKMNDPFRMSNARVMTYFSDEYIGCYKDTANRDLGGELINFPLDNTPHKCISLCKDKGKHTYTI